MAGERISINGAQAIIGRDPAQCQIVLAQAVISRRHAQIELDAQGRVVITTSPGSGCSMAATPRASAWVILFCFVVLLATRRRSRL